MAFGSRDKHFCEAVSAIYTASGCGSLPASSSSGAQLILSKASPQQLGVRKVKPDFEAALSQGM